MKTRNSLVSNSSSSSFIVHYKDIWLNPKKGKFNLLTLKQESILKKNGYKLCECGHPSLLENDSRSVTWITSKKQLTKALMVSYVKGVTCNQNDEIYFLVKNNIPFTATVHYGHETYIYPKDSKYIFLFHNRVCNAETYHQWDTEKHLSILVKDYLKYPSAEKILVSKFIKDEEKFQKKHEENLKNEDKT